MMPGLEILVSQSFGKNMGLYGERIGFLGGVVNDKSVVPNIMTQLSLVIRPMYSNPAGQGAKIVGKILSDPILFKGWTEEIKDNVLEPRLVLTPPEDIHPQPPFHLCCLCVPSHQQQAWLSAQSQCCWSALSQCSS